MELAVQEEELKKRGALIDFDDETASAGISNQSSTANLVDQQTVPAHEDHHLSTKMSSSAEFALGLDDGASSNSALDAKRNNPGESHSRLLPASNGSKKVSNSNSTSSLDRISGSKALNKLKYSMLSNTDERIYYNAIKVLWYAGEKSRALSELSSFVEGFSHNQLDANAKKRLSGRFGSSDTWII